jgi:peptidoglycan LD-endopeptidase LytH
MKIIDIITALLFALAFYACTVPGSSVLKRYTPPHQQYAERLEKAGLRESALGSQWFAAAGKSFSEAIPVALPYRESGFFGPEKPRAVAFRFKAVKGQTISISLDIKPTGAKMFAELWKPGKNGSSPVFLRADDSGKNVLEYGPEETEEIVLRIQPELLVAVSYTLTLAAGPSLGFPVSDGKAKIGSFWGDSREGGARKHEGVDIFAKFRSPVIAAEDGFVTGVNENRLGGRTVWMRPRGKNMVLYYAHLDSQMVRPFTSVKKGDTLGLIGNTGNARYTPSHLHFGIYTANGPVDPLPYVEKQPEQPEKISGRTELLSRKARTSGKQKLLSSPVKGSAVITSLESKTWISISGAAGDYYKVFLPDGTSGFLLVKGIDTLNAAVKVRTLASGADLLYQPDSAAPVVTEVPAHSKVSVSSYFGEYAYVSFNEKEGWMGKNRLK